MKFTKNVIKLLMVYAVAMGLTVILFKTVWMLSLIPTASMEGTLMAGDLVFGTRYGVGEEDIERYDILVFIPPDKPEVTYIKRVIGLPGETIEVSNGQVYADGVLLDDSFVRGPMNRKGDGTYVVPEGCYFFLGDNRNQSNDSRFWIEKYIPLENIEGKARFIIFPFKNLGSVLYN